MTHDNAIRQNLENELQLTPEVNHRTIGVIVNRGIVTLTSEVDHLGARRVAEEIAKRTDGVRAIANEIRVTSAMPGVRSDSEIAMAAANALSASLVTRAADIRPVVQNGWITLTGEVQIHLQKAAAELALRGLLGVRMVVNNIDVRSAREDARDSRSAESARDRSADHALARRM